jgi:hypothetical protein
MAALLSTGEQPSYRNVRKSLIWFTRKLIASYLVLRNYRNEQLESAIPAEDVTRVCLKLRHLIQECVPCEMDEGKITTPHSQVLTPQVIKTAKEAGGQDFRGCVVGAECSPPICESNQLDSCNER